MERPHGGGSLHDRLIVHKTRGRGTSSRRSSGTCRTRTTSLGGRVPTLIVRQLATFVAGAARVGEAGTSRRAIGQLETFLFRAPAEDRACPQAPAGALRSHELGAGRAPRPERVPEGGRRERGPRPLRRVRGLRLGCAGRRRVGGQVLDVFPLLPPAVPRGPRDVVVRTLRMRAGLVRVCRGGHRPDRRRRDRRPDREGVRQVRGGGGSRDGLPDAERRAGDRGPGGAGIYQRRDGGANHHEPARVRPPPGPVGRRAGPPQLLPLQPEGVELLPRGRGPRPEVAGVPRPPPIWPPPPGGGRRARTAPLRARRRGEGAPHPAGELQHLPDRGPAGVEDDRDRPRPGREGHREAVLEPDLAAAVTSIRAASRPRRSRSAAAALAGLHRNVPLPGAGLAEGWSDDLHFTEAG
ncbi:hypothetical protein THAOC_06054 [Thalassiosira oceanica]|uniref:Uncharacterized protein n=1 Tax=Thalassiosira oceanica TaxID=159749 RepID=K0TM54_THAOC|nr:hypothetical protein THAOC_06054 [Thalassiosira oceanica]|eukprot:EJK72417.1 hypothetical protein THAOC_06054 [Thalassiosira oceanica]